MDHRTVIRSLSAEQRAHLVRKSDRQGLAHLAGHWGFILLFGALIVAQVPYWPLLLLPQGLLIVFLFTLLHETSHRTAFEKVWLNKMVARICGMLIVLPPEWFRYFHFEHHRHTQDPERDPELREAKPETLLGFLVHISGLPVWRYQVLTLLRNTFGHCDDAFVPRSGRVTVRKEAQIMILLYSLIGLMSVAFGSAALIYAWVLPALLGQPFLRLYLMAEHGGCPQESNMFENSRTTFTNWVIRKIAWNMPFHAEHHAFPAVPFYRLPNLHQLTRPHLQKTENGYVRFHREYVAELMQ
ncbi:MAG: fatty acid desaturase [Pseudomonadota bacterium]